MLVSVSFPHPGGVDKWTSVPVPVMRRCAQPSCASAVLYKAVPRYCTSAHTHIPAQVMGMD